MREPGIDVFERALVQLAQEAEALGRPLPDVRLVRVGTDSVVLELATPSGPAVGPFVASDDTRWVLSPGLLTEPPLEGPRALPSLVTLGFAGSDTVLLNLDSVGTLAITGPLEATADVLNGFAAELAFGPASTLTERALCLADPAIADAVEAGGIAVEVDPARLAAALTTVMSAARDADTTNADPPLIVLCDQALDVRVPPRSGCALITTSPVAGAGATLAVHEAGMAVLLPERVRLAPQTLSRTATADVVEALSAADLPGTGAGGAGGVSECPQERSPVRAHPVAHGRDDLDARGSGQGALWASDVRPPEVIDLRVNAGESGPWQARGTGSQEQNAEEQNAEEPNAEEQNAEQPDAERPDSEEPDSGLTAPGGVQPHSHPDNAAPRVLLLGEILVENAVGRCESTRIGRLAETAAFVLLNPGARPSELQGALWPGRRSNPQTCRQMISRTRTWLGRTEAGEPYLMAFAESGGRLRLRDEVSSDWADFQRLAELGLADPTDTEHLTKALSLVRGRPFGAVASRELPWADIHINEMISLISDVAFALAVRHEQAGSRLAARDAALRGLRTECESEVLEEIVARTVG